MNYWRAEPPQSADAAQAFLKGATRMLMDLQRASRGQPFWCDLGSALLPLALLRQARVGHALRLIRSYQAAGPCAGVLQALAALLEAEPPIPPHAGATRAHIALQCFSPRDDDAAIVAALAQPACWPQATEHCWLGGWLGWRYAVLVGDDASVQNTRRQAVRRRRDEIPASLERPAIWRELDDGVPARWVAAQKPEAAGV
jgi:hypothetical protein